MTTLLLPGTSKTALAAATHFHAANPPIPYVLGTRSSSATNTYTDSATSLTHPTLTLSYADPSTWAPAFATASPAIKTLYLVPPPGLPTFVSDSKAFLAFAASAGVTRIVWLSASLVPRGGPAHGQVHAYLHELAATAPGEGKQPLTYAVLRPTWFAQNFTSRAHFHNASVRAEGALYSATGTGRAPWVDARDIGAVAYHALTAPAGAATPEGKEYLILGPELASYDDIALLLTEILGREVRHVPLSVDALAERFVGLGLPEAYAPVLAGMDAAIAAGAEERLEGGCVEEVTGRKPRGLREVFEEAKREGAWD